MFRKLLCLLLCLCLMSPALALAQQDATGLRFSLQCQMDPAAFPQGDRKILSGIADLTNMLTLNGTLDQSYTGSFDLNAEVVLTEAEGPAPTLRLYGDPSTWMVQSSLLGDETLRIDMIILLEFALKGYAHLEVPMQRAALLISPYVHESALEALLSAFNGVMNATQGDRIIPKEDVLALAGQFMEIAESDSAFQHWVQAIAMEAGYDEVIFETFYTLTEWAEEIIAEEGITIATSGATETWRTGETTLFTRTVEDTVTAWAFTLPTTYTGYKATVKYNGQPDGEHLLHILIADDYDEAVLDAAVKAVNIPDLQSEVPIEGDFSLQVDMTGMALMDEMHLLFEGQGANGDFTLSKLDPATRAPQLTFVGTLHPYTPTAAPDFTAEQYEGTPILSINDATLTPLLERIASPLITGLIPILVATPASSVQALLDLLTESGILDLVLRGGSSAEAE